MDETFSSIDWVTDCLLDTERTQAFGDAISKIVKPGSVVLDSGTGSGVMSLFAAKAGAKKIYALEIDAYVAKTAETNIKNNKFDNVIEVVNEDIRVFNFPEGTVFDVVIMEMLTTGMVDEYQVWTVNHLFEKGVVNENTIFVPGIQNTYISLGYTDFNMYGFEIPMVLHTWSWLNSLGRFSNFSNKEKLNTVVFNSGITDQKFEKNIDFKIRISGKINSVLLNSVTDLGDGNVLGDTLALNGPVIIPLEEFIDVVEGQTLSFNVSYYFGNGYRNLKIKLNK